MNEILIKASDDLDNSEQLLTIIKEPQGGRYIIRYGSLRLLATAKNRYKYLFTIISEMFKICEENLNEVYGEYEYTKISLARHIFYYISNYICEDLLLNFENMSIDYYVK